VDRILARLERRLGRFAPERLILYAVGISGLFHLLVFQRPDALRMLYLYPQALERGEVWRLFTFLFAPPGPLSGFDIVWAIFWLLLMYTMGNALEAQWGSFRFDLFLFSGALATLAVGFTFGPVTGAFVSQALLIAFAAEFPDYEILLLVLPVKMKYLGGLSAGLMVWELIGGDAATRAAVAVALGDVLLFCGPTLRSRIRGASGARRKVAPAFAPAPRKTRVCAKCGRSDADDPSLEFRVCDCQEKCHGKLTEYCIEHARAH
jgi:hypothetical protein